MNKVTLFAILLLTLSLHAEEKSSEGTTPTGKEKDWLQAYVQEQQKIQENRNSDSPTKSNPFQAIAKPTPSSTTDSSKSPEPFALINNKNPSSVKSVTPIDSTRPINTDTTFKPSISAYSNETFYKEKQENESRKLVEQMESSSLNKNANDEIKEEDLLEKARREKLQQSINSKAANNLLNKDLDQYNNLNIPDPNTIQKNPYLQKNPNRPDIENNKFNPNEINRLPTIQMIKPIETPQMIENPALQRSVFENPTFRPQNQGSIYNQMMNVPGTTKGRIQDPNDFLHR